MKSNRSSDPPEENRRGDETVERADNLADLLAKLEPLEEDLPEIADPPSRPENLL